MLKEALGAKYPNCIGGVVFKARPPQPGRIPLPGSRRRIHASEIGLNGSKAI